MGCVFNTMHLDGSFDRHGVRDAFQNKQDQDCYENGHSYSGGFGMASGLEFPNLLTFKNYGAAYDWLSYNANKWGPALAVRYIQDGKERWMIGANCSS